MARIPIRVTLDSANVPMVSYQAGPTVVPVKEGMAKLRSETKPTDVPWELTRASADICRECNADPKRVDFHLIRCKGEWDTWRYNFL